MAFDPYSAIGKRVLFNLDAEHAHNLTLKSLTNPLVVKAMQQLFGKKTLRLPTKVMGLNFPNPLGLAAGMDKNAEAINGFKALGFGYVEVGTVTPKPQPGNPLPRLFRLSKDKALINRMGFNNDGAIAVAKRLEKRPNDFIVGINIGKNKITPNEKAINDYLSCFTTLYDYADYIVINVSSPNTPGLRELQNKEELEKLFQSLINEREKRASKKPIVVKIAPDVDQLQLESMAEVILENKIDGIIATNTTTSREGLVTAQKFIEEIGQGGLSGKPLKSKSTDTIEYLRKIVGKELPIIGVGGINDEASAREKLSAGANLLQIYTGLVYKGPQLINDILNGFVKDGVPMNDIAAFNH